MLLQSFCRIEVISVWTNVPCLPRVRPRSWDFRQKHRDLDGTLCGGFKAARWGEGMWGSWCPLQGPGWL